MNLTDRLAAVSAMARDGLQDCKCRECQLARAVLALTDFVDTIGGDMNGWSRVAALIALDRALAKEEKP